MDNKKEYFEYDVPGTLMTVGCGVLGAFFGGGSPPLLQAAGFA